MKRIKYLVIFLSFILLQCSNQTTGPSSNIYVSFNIETNFQNDLVIVELNNSVIFNGKVTTDHVVGLAWSSGLQKLEKKEYLLNFSVIDNNAQKKYTLDMTRDTSTVVIRYDKNPNQITIDQINGRVLYR